MITSPGRLGSTCTTVTGVFSSPYNLSQLSEFLSMGLMMVYEAIRNHVFSAPSVSHDVFLDSC